MIKKVLIANRGEIALRVIRSCNEMGIKTVAVYSTADKESLHVRFADEAVCIGPPVSKESYLSIPKIMAAAEITNSDAIHPGYGFLSENAEFSKICSESGIKFVGPDWKMIERMGDKVTAKETMKEAGIPTVPGSDGLLNSIKEAKAELKEMLTEAKFGSASAKVVIEEFLDGIELSVFVLTDGNSYKILPTAKDYKRIGEGDTGLNTGGMGAISPVPFADSVFMQKIEERIVKPTIEGLKKDNLPYKGFIFIGLIKVDNEPMVIEYNVRMGDPETEAVLPRIKSDLLELFQAVGEGKLAKKTLELDPRFATTVMLVSGGYPEAYEKDKNITGIEDVQDSIVFHAGTKIEGSEILTNGGRVLALTSLGEKMNEALANSFANADKIKFEGKYYRNDIGFDM